MAGLPGFLREGFLPLGAFYVGLRLNGLAAGIAAGAAASLLIYLYERRAGRDALLVRISLGFVVVQSAVGLASNSTTVYLAQPVLIAAAWGLAFFVSIALGRPLAGALACAWYPFPRWFRETESYKRVFGIESLVWGAYFLGRSAIRLAVLLNGSLESFLLVTVATGTPAMVLLLLWSIRYSIRNLADADPQPDEALRAAA
jgi:intracellular septation protein A